MKQKTKAAVLFISGQSNAHAHGQRLRESERITQPLRNVFSLDREPNQSFGIADVVWSGFTTAGKNLGEIQDHTASLAYYFALLWQNAVNGGESLPDLYIVQMSVGSQGIVNGMWNPDRERVMIPGPLGTVNISLFPWAMQVNRLALTNLEKQGLEPEVIGWHWLGCEQDLWDGAYLRADLRQRYDDFFDAMLASMGGTCPAFLYKLYLENFCREHGIPGEGNDTINRELLRQCGRHPRMTLVRAEDSPYWDPSLPHLGIFAPDDGHYLAGVQKWYAGRFFNEVYSSCK